MERVAMYLRKSRADLEAEARGEGETLAKHKKALMRTAKTLGLNIIKIREEIVSGESLLHRPEMNELLREVERKEYDAVLVMDVDRLGRGNMQEQGLILETFRTASTKIITPRKTYDLNDEFDEEYSEFEAFMARKELKIINRRLQGGRVRSVEEGNYIGTRPPYGYDVVKEGKSRYLVPNEEQSKVVKMIFDWYTNDDPEKRLGSDKISNELNMLGFKTYTGMSWKSSSVLTIIKNPVYIGLIQWKKKETKKTATGRVVKTRDEKDIITAKGKHVPLVSDELFKKAQEILKGKYHVPYQLENGLINPLAGIMRCAKCGYSMVYRPYTGQPGHLICYNKECDCRSSRFTFVEDAVMNGLEEWLKEYKIHWSKHKREFDNSSAVELKQIAYDSLLKEAAELEKQKNRLHDFLERGIYDEDIYLERSQSLAERMKETNTAIDRTTIELEQEKNRVDAQQNIIPTIQNVIKLYRKTKDPAKKNALLKSILVRVEYKKERHQRNDDFELKLIPRI
ncbi:recombinase family protein [Paenibacillus sp. PDC88]|uniref:recombinase family protein n=1 Tax=Paenibacillus sp. PDC88 TaxID=1884375 RepID=UPI00089CA3C0|nr:recombinase family protein [Paenibacillus sp. PDC88]SDX04368.1 Site-specific DNA recombinase [Paenibacillus sp. PDC88]